MLEYNIKHRIFTIDADYFRPQLASIHIVQSKSKLALIDTGTNHSIDNIKAGLHHLKCDFSDVHYIILTHIHLDHAGGASQLMQLCPNASLIVHTKGARHMVDPSKLIAGTKAVYGEDKFAALYGDILPIDTQRVYSPQDEEVLNMEDRSFTFIDSPGHANHHFCIYEKHSKSVFTGDTLGIAYPQLRNEGRLFLMPTTTPVQFDPEKMHQSIDRVMQYQPEALYLTHYGGIAPNARLIAGLHEQIEDYVQLTEQAASQVEAAVLTDALSAQLYDYLKRRCINEIGDTPDDVLELCLKMDAQLNAQGLAFWWQHRR